MKRILCIVLSMILIFTVTRGLRESPAAAAAAAKQDSIKYKDGSKYTGQLVNGVPHGKGTLTYPKGDVKKYVGEFKNGMIDGNGTLYYANGKKVTGKFINSVLAKYTVLTALKSGKRNYGSSLQNGKAYGDFLYITFDHYDAQIGTFSGTIVWDEIVYGYVDTNQGKVQSDKLVFSQVSRTYKGNVYDFPSNTITVRMTDVNHLSGTWSVPSANAKGTIQFTINPDDVSHLSYLSSVHTWLDCEPRDRRLLHHEDKRRSTKRRADYF
ncbi:hypothetical protein [Paenibacillus sp. OV219]|uniref:hypothetical protein n=1 Tax=Paenibacillus sp. OV219 TaxID=1884377 RepID=UPI0015A690CE|nr:hypothetical protein [Paenibacillus sp. OV219]